MAALKSGELDIQVSSPKELHLQVLSEPDLNLSAHPLPLPDQRQSP